jgi:plasmid maintenance system antidote protein VapI
LRLGHFFGTSAQFWLNLQALYDLRQAEGKVGDAISKLPTLDLNRSGKGLVTA